MEYSPKPFEFKDLRFKDEGHGSITGYASTFGNWDSVSERPIKGAFTPHLSSFLKDGFIALGHSWSALPVATPTQAVEDAYGLLLTADFHSTPEAQAARTVVQERMARGKSVTLSIGYEVLQDEYGAEGRLLKEIKLYEVSLVNVPANTAAAVTSAKSGVVSALPFDDHANAAEAAVSAFAQRARERANARTKEGRVLSDANRKRIATLLESLTSVQQELRNLLATTEPTPDPAKALALFAEFQRLEAHLNGAFQ